MRKSVRNLVISITKNKKINLDKLKGNDNLNKIDQEINFIRSNYNTRMLVLKEVFKQCDDVKYIDFSLNKTLKNDSSLIYLNSLIDDKEITQRILNPLLNINLEEREQDLTSEINVLVRNGVLATQITTLKSFSEAVDSVLGGKTVILSKNTNDCFAVPTKKELDYQIIDSLTETSLIGPKTAFTNNSMINNRIIRNYIESHKLKIRSIQIGLFTKTEVSVIYIDGLAPQDVVEDIVDKVKQIEIDGILDVTYIEEIIEPKQISFFPLMLNTERVDRVIGNLLEGRVAMQVNGSNTFAIMPITIDAFFQTPEDYYLKPVFSTFIRFFRYVAFFLASTATPLYIAISVFHYEVIPYKLLIPFAESISPIPFPPLFEALLLEVFAQILSESSNRVAGTMGPMIGILGAVLVGQAAIQAHIASPVLVITIAIGIVSSFSIPNYNFIMVARVIKFILIVFAGMF